MENNYDTVNNPKHYTESKVEVIDAIDAWGLNYHLGNCVKYVARAGKKDKTKELEDLRKAQWYLTRAINTLEGRVFIKPRVGAQRFAETS